MNQLFHRPVLAVAFLAAALFSCGPVNGRIYQTDDAIIVEGELISWFQCLLIQWNRLTTWWSKLVAKWGKTWCCHIWTFGPSFDNGFVENWNTKKNNKKTPTFRPKANLDSKKERKIEEEKFLGNDSRSTTAKFGKKKSRQKERRRKSKKTKNRTNRRNRADLESEMCGGFIMEPPHGHGRWIRLSLPPMPSASAAISFTFTFPSQFLRFSLKCYSHLCYMRSQHFFHIRSTTTNKRDDARQEPVSQSLDTMTDHYRQLPNVR